MEVRGLSSLSGNGSLSENHSASLFTIEVQLQGRLPVRVAVATSATTKLIINIFLVVREMPGDFTKWQEMLDEDMEILTAMGRSAERKVTFCRSIKMACTLYEYY